MKRNLLSFVHKALNDQRGQVLPWVALGMVGFLGMSGLVVDVGHLYVVHRQLQGATNAAALAAMGSLSGSTTDIKAAANTYGSDAGGLNPVMGLTGVKTTVSTSCIETMVTSGSQCISININGTNKTANAVKVTQSVSVPTYFMRVLGVNSVDLTATATASSSPQPYNVAVIIDTTGSMGTYDSYCQQTQLACALEGLQILLKALKPSADPVALFTFPAQTANSVGQDYCDYSAGSLFFPQYPYPAIPDKSSSSTDYNPTGTSPTYKIVDFSTDYRTSDTATDLNLSSNLVKAAGANSGCNGLQLAGSFSWGQDWVGSTWSQGGQMGPGVTWYSGVIYAAQAALLAKQRERSDHSKNVIIFLSDGNANLFQAAMSHGKWGSIPVWNGRKYVNKYGWIPTSTPPTPLTDALSHLTSQPGAAYPSWDGDCGQAVLASKTARDQGTIVYSVAYGAEPTGCPTDSTAYAQWRGVSSSSFYKADIVPCQTMFDIATPDSNDKYFYSDYQAVGSDTTCVATQKPSDLVSLSKIFASIGADMANPRLIPNSLNATWDSL